MSSTALSFRHGMPQVLGLAIAAGSAAACSGGSGGGGGTRDGASDVAVRGERIGDRPDRPRGDGDRPASDRPDGGPDGGPGMDGPIMRDLGGRAMCPPEDAGIADAGGDGAPGPDATGPLPDSVTFVPGVTVTTLAGGAMSGT